MNKKIFLLPFLLLTGLLWADTPTLGFQKPIFVGVVENRQKQLEKLRQERERLQKERQEEDTPLKAVAAEVKDQLDLTTKELESKSTSDYLKQKQLLLNELYQAVRDISRERERLVQMLDEFIRDSQEFIKDPDFAAFRKEHGNERLFYSFDNLQQLYNHILDQEKKVSLLTEQEKNAIAELDNRKRAQSATKDTYKAKRSLIETGRYVESDSINAQQRTELIALEERIYLYKKILDALYVKETEYKIDHTALQLSIAKAHLNIYRDYLRSIKPAVRVTEADIIHAKEEFAKATMKYRVIKEKYRSEIDKLLGREELVQKELQETAKRYGITLGKEVTEWSKEGLQTPTAYIAFCEVATLQLQLNTLQRRRELLEAYIELEDEKLREENLKLQGKESFHKKYTTEEEITLELKKYEAPKAESQTSLARFKERINIVADAMNAQKKILDRIHTMRLMLEKQRETIFRSHAAEYHRCFELFRMAEALESDQIDTLSKLTGVYSGLTSIINNKIRLISFITSELESRTIWHRPEYAITWEGIKNILPDMVNFLSFVRNYFTRGAIIGTFTRFFDAFKDPVGLLILFLKLFIIGIMLIILYRFLPLLIKFFENSSDSRIGRMLSALLAGTCTYLYAYFLAIALWIMIFCTLIFQDVVDTYLYIIFYLLSIPYLLFLINRFINTMARYNQEHDYAFIAPDFQRRFWVVLSALLYSTIAIFFFREAFMLAHYYRSELPTILLAVNFIIFQICLILLIDKEQILSFIPTSNDFWQWMHTQVDRFYYLMLFSIISIIIMSNPYVGFGRLVLYISFGLVYSVALLLVLYWLHGLLKRISSRVFFAAMDDVARERFSNAKTWFGITIIFSFLLLSFLGIVVAAKIWGWPITLSKVTELFAYPLIGRETETPITLITFFKILVFIFIGFIIAYALNKFVLERIFDLLLVDPGVQHTVSTIAQYLIIIIAVFLGFQNANLGSLVNYIVGALILGLGWVLKEPISDFVAYFIILVQRPIKIGDFIKIDNEITGVVRKITARAVILRRKNSTTLVVPNAFLLNKTIINWNYSRGFIAFDDIIVRVDYHEDPEKIRELLYTIVESYPNILKNPKPWIRLDDFDEFGFQFMVRGFISSVYTLEKWEIASSIRINIAKVFKEKGIRFAVPARLLLTKNDGLIDSGSGIKEH